MSVETRIFLICGGILITYILVAVVIPLLPETIGRIRNWIENRNQRKRCKAYSGYVLGEIVGARTQERPSANLIFDMLNRNVGYKYMIEDEYTYYNSYYTPIVRYIVEGEAYEISVGCFSKVSPVLGQKAWVYYNPYNPMDAAADITCKYYFPLKIYNRDKNSIYCSCGFKKNISIPCSEVDEQALPGRTLVHRYGAYSLNLEPARMVKGLLRVERLDDEFAYCNYRFKKDLMVPLKDVANGTPKQGDKIVYKYQYFYIK